MEARGLSADEQRIIDQKVCWRCSTKCQFNPSLDRLSDRILRYFDRLSDQRIALFSRPLIAALDTLASRSTGSPVSLRNTLCAMEGSPGFWALVP